MDCEFLFSLDLQRCYSEYDVKGDERQTYDRLLQVSFVFKFLIILKPLAA